MGLALAASGWSLEPLSWRKARWSRWLEPYMVGPVGVQLQVEEIRQDASVASAARSSRFFASH